MKGNNIQNWKEKKVYLFNLIELYFNSFQCTYVSYEMHITSSGMQKVLFSFNTFEENSPKNTFLEGLGRFLSLDNDVNKIRHIID